MILASWIQRLYLLLFGLGYKQTWLKWVGVKSSKLRDLESLGYMFRVLERLRFKVQGFDRLVFLLSRTLYAHHISSLFVHIVVDYCFWQLQSFSNYSLCISFPCPLHVVEWGHSLIHALTMEVLVEACPIVLQLDIFF